MRQTSRDSIRTMAEQAKNERANPRTPEEQAERIQKAIERSRNCSPYSVEVDENLITVSQNYRGILHENRDETLTIVLPHVIGVSSIREDDGYLNLLVFSVHMRGGEKMNVFSAAPFDHFAPDGRRDSEKNNSEREWHRQRLAVQRHQVLVALNDYLRRRHPTTPNTQLSLGF